MNRQAAELTRFLGGEPVSNPGYPDNRENTGNFVDLAGDPTILRLSNCADSMSYEQIPYSEEQGN